MNLDMVQTSKFILQLLTRQRLVSAIGGRAGQDIQRHVTMAFLNPAVQVLYSRRGACTVIDRYRQAGLLARITTTLTRV
jgi:hypothetical protein